MSRWPRDLDAEIAKILGNEALMSAAIVRWFACGDWRQNRADRLARALIEIRPCSDPRTASAWEVAWSIAQGAALDQVRPPSDNGEDGL